ncbi:DinB family protein [Psychrobacter urativorans]|uniref:DinB family protein n=1 Tax=Psychrobacter urativorans TaxID=45610 RepID=UPI003BB79C78
MKLHFSLLANYNAVMNQKINDSLADLSEDALWKDNQAFFHSILGTLNHLMAGDLLWLRRFTADANLVDIDVSDSAQTSQSLADFPSITTLTQTLYLSKSEFINNRQALDKLIIEFIEQTLERDYAKVLTYINTKNLVYNKPFSMLLQHFFNHQTHHRGQVTTLLNQAGIDIGETDLLMLIADV